MKIRLPYTVHRVPHTTRYGIYRNNMCHDEYEDKFKAEERCKSLNVEVLYIRGHKAQDKLDAIQEKLEELGAVDPSDPHGWRA